MECTVITVTTSARACKQVTSNSNNFRAIRSPLSGPLQ